MSVWFWFHSIVATCGIVFSCVAVTVWWQCVCIPLVPLGVCLWNSDCVWCCVCKCNLSFFACVSVTVSQSECSVMTGWCWVGWSASDYMCPPSRYVIVIVRDICGYWFGKAVTIWEWLCVSWWWVELSDCLFSGFEIVTVYKSLEVSVIVWLYPCICLSECVVVVMFVWHWPFVSHQVCQCEVHVTPVYWPLQNLWRLWPWSVIGSTFVTLGLDMMSSLLRLLSPVWRSKCSGYLWLLF